MKTSRNSPLFFIFFVGGLLLFFVWIWDDQESKTPPLAVEKPHRSIPLSNLPAESFKEVLLPSPPPPGQSPKIVSSHTKKSPDDRFFLHRGPLRIRPAREDMIPVDEEGRMIIHQVFIDGKEVIFQGDLLLGNLEELGLDPKHPRPPLILVPKPKKWPGTNIPYEIRPDVINPERIVQAVEILNEKTVVKFIPRRRQKDYIVFTKGGSHCYSYVGFQGGAQKVSLAENCSTVEILHELIHALGFFHEQAREDRDDFIEIHWDNIQEKFHSQFKRIPKEFNFAADSPFDFGSLMLYSSFAFSKTPDMPSITLLNGEEYPGNGKGPSPKDLERINSLYQE